MADPEALRVLQLGVDAWNTGLDPKLTSKFDLSNADLRGRNLAGINFRGTILAGADCRDATFTRVIFKRADLSNAHLERADLSGAVFGDEREGANLQDAQFREAILRDCDLSSVKGGLRPQQLAGADLTGATLPGPLADLFKDLKAVDNISESARKLFVAMLAACLYSWLAIATTTDLNLITNRASSPLPIIQTSIPIVGFYVVAPLLLLCVYFYFHFYLQKLWEELGSLPAIFPDGRRLHERSDPWLLNDLVRSHMPLLKEDRPFMSYFQQAISIVLAWWLVPITLFFFWGRYLPRHDFRWTTLQVLLLAVSITGAIRLHRLAGATLRGDPRRPFFGTRTLRTLQAYGASATFVVTGVAFMLVSVGAIRGVPPGEDPWWRDGPSGRWGWVPRAMAVVHYSPFANLGQADVSVKPPNWTGRNQSELDLVKGAELAEADLRYAWAAGAFLAKANLIRARLEGAELPGTDLRQANLNEAHLTGSNLVLDKLTGADLTGAQLTGAHLIGADLGAAHLTGSDLTGAVLDMADLRFAEFRSDLTLFPEGTKGLVAYQVTVALNWDKAYYDDDIRQELGLPPDHNQKLAEEQKREEQQKGKPAAKVPASNASRSGAGDDKSANAP